MPDRYPNITLIGMPCSAHLKLPLAGEDADPLVVVVSDDDVSVGMHGHARRPLHLAGGPPPDAKAALKLPVVREDLGQTTDNL